LTAGAGATATDAGVTEAEVTAAAAIWAVDCTFDAGAVAAGAVSFLAFGVAASAAGASVSDSAFADGLVGFGVAVGAGLLEAPPSSSSAAGVGSGFGSAAGSGVAVGVGSAVGSGVAVGAGSAVGSGSAGVIAAPLDDDPVLVCALTTPAGADPEPVVASVALESVAVAEDVDVDVVGAVPDVVSVVEAAGPVLAASVFDLAPPSVEDEVPVSPPSSANATPCPVTTAVPTPSATASPPTRPM
jgi:hypothetical protein